MDAISPLKKVDLGQEAKLVCVSECVGGQIFIAAVGADRGLNVHAAFLPGMDTLVHSSLLPVSPSSLAFSHDGQHLATGCLNGSVLIKDVATGSVAGALKARGSEDRYVSALAQDPGQEQVWAVASGSLASSVRLWDARTPEPAQSFPVASKRVNDLQFSPDSHMLAAASDDCSVTVRSLLDASSFQLRAHSGPVSAARFSPHEYLLATASADKTVRFWDLETRECVTQSSPLPGPVADVLFDVCEDLLWVGAQGGLRMVKGYRCIGWEPERVFMHIVANPTAIIDLPETHDLCILSQTSPATLLLATLSVTERRPIARPDNFYLHSPEEAPLSESILRAGTAALSISSPLTPSAPQVPSASAQGHQLPSTSSISPSETPSPETPEREFVDETEAFRPRPRLTRSPPPTTSEAESQSTGEGDGIPSPLHLPPSNVWSSAASCASDSLIDTVSEDLDPPPTIFIQNGTPIKAAVPKFTVREDVVPIGSVKTPSPSAQRRSLKAPSSLKKPSTPSSATVDKRLGGPGERKKSVGVATVKPQKAVVSPQPAALPAKSAKKTEPSDEWTKNASCSSLNRLSLNPADFLIEPCGSGGGGGLGGGGGAAWVEAEASQMEAVLGQRAKRLGALAAAWRHRGPRAAADIAAQSADLALTKDLLAVMSSGRNDCWTLETAALLLPCLRDLIGSSNRSGYARDGGVVQAGKEALVVLLRRFGDVIRGSARAGGCGIGVDVEAETRSQRSRLCLSQLQAIRADVLRRLSEGKAGKETEDLRDIAVLLSDYDP